MSTRAPPSSRSDRGASSTPISSASPARISGSASLCAVESLWCATTGRYTCEATVRRELAGRLSQFGRPRSLRRGESGVPVGRCLARPPPGYLRSRSAAERRFWQYSPCPAPTSQKEEQMSETIDAARKLIIERLKVIEVEAGQLQRALKSIGGTPDSRPAAATKPRRKRTAGKRRRRAQAPRGQRREQLLAAIGSKPGARPSELAAKIGIAPGL